MMSYGWSKKLAAANRFASLLSLVVLAGMGVAAHERPSAADAAGFHARVKALAQQIPEQVGPWVGSPVKVPRSAVKLLHPNILKALSYHNTVTGRSATFVLVQCKDARDLAGHYPPNCYPATGWTLDDEQARTWRVGGMTIPVMQYDFSYERASGTTRITVLDFMVLPNGKIVRSMAGVWAAAADYSEHFYGAAQVQLVMAQGLSAKAREKIFDELIGANLGLIKALRWGIRDK